MNHKTYMKTVGGVFLIVAVLHLWRLVNGFTVVFGDWTVPMWASAAGVLIAGYLSYYALKYK